MRTNTGKRFIQFKFMRMKSIFSSLAGVAGAHVWWRFVEEANGEKRSPNVVLEQENIKIIFKLFFYIVFVFLLWAFG